MIKNFIFSLLLFPLITQAQQTIKGVVSGKEKDSESPLPGVNIFWEGTTQGVVSGSNGEFEIKKGSKQHMLVFSFVGYNTQTIHVDEPGELKVVLEPNLEIEEVTVVQKDRGTYLSAMSTIKME